ncbi:MAG: GNAT family N-acetyltransferase [Pseudomonadota bacterium]
MQIREGTSVDLEAIARIHADSWRDSYRGIMEDAFLDWQVLEDRMDAWAGRFRAPPPDFQVLVAERDATVIGFICVFADEKPGWLLLDNLHVSEAARRRGAGQKLMRAMSKRLAEKGRQKVRLLVLEGNEGACRFYERLGSTKRPIEHKGFRGLGPFASIPYEWEAFGELGQATSAA